MNLKKRVNGSWVDAPNYIHNTSTDTLTTLPTVIYPTSTTATVGLKGNVTQNGTPTPSNPVEVNGVGERTANMFDVNGTYSLKSAFVTIADNSIKFENVPSGNGARIYYSTQYPAGTYYISCVTSGSNYYASRLFSDSPFTGATYNVGFEGYYRDFAKSGFSTSLTFDNDFKIGFIANAEGGATFTISDIMLSTTEADYEPYGYKISISSANTTTPVYLGEVETTRKIKKVVLTGKEDWKKSSGLQGNMYIAIMDDVVGALSMCDRAVNASTLNSFTFGKVYVEITSYSSIFLNVWLFDTDISVANFKSYLASQYAAGTPVTIWYVLETEETDIVNEPLMKIGDYADELLNVSIPITAGGDTLSVGTTVQPSEVTVNYKGWHPAIVHEHTNGAWT